MSKNVVSTGPQAFLSEAYQVMKRHEISHLPVLDDLGKLIGVLSLGDVLLHSTLVDQQISVDEKTVFEVMSKPLVTCSPETTIADIAATMIACKIQCVPVINKGHTLVGIVTSTDLLDYVCLQEEIKGLSVMPLDFIERDYRQTVPADNKVYFS